MLPKSMPLSLVTILSLFLLSPLSAIGEYTIEGVFDSSSPTHDRRKSTPFSSASTCMTLSEDSYNDNVRYAQYRIVPDSNVLLKADITTSSESPPDTLLALYCAPFDPEKPADNLVAMDDDGNGFPNAGLTTRNIALYADVNYDLVVISYSGTLNAAGSYNLVLRNELKHIHSMADAITVLQVLAGDSPAPSALGPLSDLRAGGQITLAQAIMVLKELGNN
jgi:hypothetical protein